MFFLFLSFFKSQEVAIYLLISLIKTWETFINSSICLFYIPYRLSHFPQHCPISHKATPHLVQFCFRFLKATVFLLSLSLLCFIINWSQTFFNAYKVYFVLVHDVYISHENVELVPVISLVFCDLLCFLKNRAEWTISSVSNKSLIKTAPKQSWWSSGTSLQYFRKLSCFS